jgi:hypothetical protein
VSEEKVTKEVKAHETRGVREIAPPKQQPKQQPTESKGK